MLLGAIFVLVQSNFYKDTFLVRPVERYLKADLSMIFDDKSKYSKEHFGSDK